MKHHLIRPLLLSVTALLLPAVSFSQDLTCLSEPITLYQQLQNEAYDALDRRRERFESLKTEDDIRDYQNRLREFFVRQLGGFPDKTPLNAQTVRTIDEDGYRIENVIYESRPHHHITANFYIPDGNGPFPGIVVASGHSRTAKTADYNQRFGIMMARHGMAALCFDPIGQGERSQILDSEGKNKIPGTTTEHFLIGFGSTLVGRNTASYETWDVMRSTDYLISRPEIDPQKIGMTGCSGGGTQTSYAMALDHRIACAAPACYLTTFRRLIETIGPQDAEQNIFGQLEFGLDQPDYVLLRAPKPTLISSTTQDFFDIGGSWENFRQGKRIYGRFGLSERVDLVEIEGKHGVTPQNLATIAHWFKRWLLEVDKPVEAVVLEPRPAEDLICTPAGQVLLLPEEQSVFELNAAYGQKLADQRKNLWRTSSHDALRTKIRSKINVQVDTPRNASEAKKVGTVSRAGIKIEKYVIRSGSNRMIPTLVFQPVDATGEVFLYLHDAGKLGDAEPGSRIEQLVDAGNVVVSVDLSGQGETSSAQPDAMLTDWKTYYLAYLMGRSVVGIRVEDTFAAAQFAGQFVSKDQAGTNLIAVGKTGIVGLHAAALRPETFASVCLRDTPTDWSSLLNETVPAGHLDHAVHGALELYDLPDLFDLAGPFTVAPWTKPGLFTAGIEGPACDREGNLFAVSYGDSRTIGKVTADGKSESWIQLPEGSTGNGIRFDRAGQMYVADYTGHNVLKIDPKTKEVAVLAHDSRMHQPNDLAIADDGTLYASDPDWQQGDGALWRITASGVVTRIADKMGTTNGIEVSPNGKTLYVAESRQRCVLAFDLTSQGISNERVLIRFDTHGLDGMRCDVDGNLYLTRHGAGRIVKLSPDGTVLKSIELPGAKPSNLCFGGPDGQTVYVTEVENRQILRFRVDRPGLSWQRLNAREP